MSLLYYPFILQGVLMTADEFYFHEKRGLARWEKIGHPLDSFFTLVTLSIPALFASSDSMLKVFIGFAIFSCIFITKDEFVHSEVCPKSEHWLHAMLFVLHPVIFLMTALLWMDSADHFFLRLQPFIVGSFMVYQIFRWSVPWNKLLK